MTPRLHLWAPARRSRQTILLSVLLLATGFVVHARPATAGLGKGDTVPALSWQTLAGSSSTWSELQEDRPLVVVFWATWCSVCKKEWPELIALHDEFEDTDRSPVWAAVSVGEKAPAVAREAKARGLVGTQLLDPDEENFEALDLKYIPHVFVIDTDGTVAYSGRPKIKKLRKVLESIHKRRTSTEDSR